MVKVALKSTRKIHRKTAVMMSYLTLLKYTIRVVRQISQLFPYSYSIENLRTATSAEIFAAPFLLFLYIPLNIGK